MGEKINMMSMFLGPPPTKKDQIASAVMGILFGLSIAGVPAYLGIRDGLYEQVSKAADINEDSRTSRDEWVEVYRELGVHYNIRKYNPKSDLSIKQMKRYLEKLGDGKTT